MAKGYIHVNGTTYELAREVQDIGQLADRLHSGQVQTLDVRLDGKQVSLRVDAAKVWSSAAWVGSEDVQVFG